jgi:hypothetical protein
MQLVIFYLHLMLHAYVPRFDVIGGRGNILGSERGLNKSAAPAGNSQAYVLHAFILLMIVTTRFVS